MSRRSVLANATLFPSAFEAWDHTVLTQDNSLEVVGGILAVVSEGNLSDASNAAEALGSSEDEDMLDKGITNHCDEEEMKGNRFYKEISQPQYKKTQ